MFTVHSVYKPNEDTIQRLRKRPKKILRNVKIVRVIFSDKPIKWLYISLAINDYNYHINNTDIANQRRKYKSI